MPVVIALITGVSGTELLKPAPEDMLLMWQAAIEVLMLIGENGGDSMMAHIR